MSKTILKKGFILIIPRDIRERVSFKEGEQLIVKLAGSDAIVLQRKPKEKTKDEIIDETFGAWKDEFKSSVSSLAAVNKLRKSWRRKFD